MSPLCSLPCGLYHHRPMLTFAPTQISLRSREFSSHFLAAGGGWVWNQIRKLAQKVQSDGFGLAAESSSSPSPEAESPCKRGRKKHALSRPACDRTSAVPDWQRRLQMSHPGMTNSKTFRRAYSLRGSKSPSLLDPAFGSSWDHLEEADPARRSGGAALGGHGLVPKNKEEAQTKPAWSCGRRATSLRVRKARGEEAATMGEAAHSLGPGDGQMLIGEAHGKAGGRMKKRKQQVNRALRESWETFLTNVYSLTLSRPTSRPTTDEAQAVGTP
ncbi:uncharacterized protein LOC114587203 [Podarcis muralis]